MIAGQIEIQLMADVARIRRDMDQARQVVGNASASMERAANSVRAAFGGIFAGLGLSQLIQMSDSYAKFTAQLRLATTSTREYAAAYGDVKRISTSAQQDLQATGMLYARIANGTRELGTSQKQVAAITETVNMALKVSGATTAEAASAQLQLSQAFASGTLRGEEFNAVNEAAPRLMKALADGMGVPVGALKAMATEGKITSAIMAEVLPRALEDLRNEAKEVQTIAGAFTVLKNNLMEFVGVQANASGAVSALTGAIGFLANNLTLLAGAMLTVMAAKLGSWLTATATAAIASAASNRTLATSTLAAGVATTEAARVAAAAKLVEAQANVAATSSASALAAARVVELRASVLAASGAVQLALAQNGLIPAQARSIALAEANAIALAAQAVAANAATTTAVAHTGALAAQATAATLTTRAMGILRATMAFFGGPIGLIITLLGAAATAWMVWGNKAKEGNDLAKESAVEASTVIIAELDKQIQKNQRIIEMRKQGATIDQAHKNLKNTAALGALGNDLAALNRGDGQFSGMSNEDKFFAREKIMKSILDLQGKINLAETTGAAATALTQGEARLKFMSDYATKQEQMNAKLAEAKKLLGAAFTADDEARIRAAFADKGVASGIKAEATAYTTLATSIGEKIAANKLELSGYDKLTEAQKMTIKLDEAIASGKNKLTPKHIAEAHAMIATVDAQDRLIEENKFYLKQTEEKLEVAGSAIRAAEDEAERNENLARTFGMTASAVAQLELARLEEKLAQADASKGYTLEISQLEALIDAKKRSSAALGSVEAMAASKKATEDIAADYKKMSESIRDSLTDALLRGFESGKSFGRNLIDTLKNMFKTLVLQPTIQGILAPIAGGVASMMPGAAQAAGGGTDIFGVASAAKTAYSAISGGFAGIATTVAETVQATMYATGMTTQIASNGALATGAGAAAGYLGGAAVGVYGGRALSNGYGISGSGNGLVNAGTAIGAIVGGPIGAAIGGLIAGAANRLFGMKAKEITGTTLNGSFGAQGFSGSTEEAWLRKGGVFRSDKTGVDKTAIDAATAKQFTVGYDALKAASADFAQVLGINADSIKTRAQSMSIAITSDEEANKKAISEFFIGVGDSIANELLPTLSDFAKEGEGASATLQRLATNYATIDAALTSIGLVFNSVGVGSLAARERLVDLSGGIQALAQNAAGFAQNFLTEAERIAPVAAAVSKAMGDLGFSMVDTREEFKVLVQGLDLTTESGAKNYAELMKLQGAFAQVTEGFMRTQAEIMSERAGLQGQLDELTLSSAQLLTKQRDALDASNRGLFDQVEALKAQKSATEKAAEATAIAISKAKEAAEESVRMQQSMIQSFAGAVGDAYTRAKEAAKALREFNDALVLGNLSALDPDAKYREAKKQFEAADPGDMNAVTAFLQASKDRVADSFYYDRDFAAAQVKLAKGATDAESYAARLPEFLRGISAAITAPAPLAPMSASAPPAVYVTGTMSAIRASNAPAPTADTKVLEARLDAMSKKMEGALETIAASTSKMADQFDRVTEGGNAMVNA